MAMGDLFHAVFYPPIFWQLGNAAALHAKELLCISSHVISATCDLTAHSLASSLRLLSHCKNPLNGNHLGSIIVVVDFLHASVDIVQFYVHRHLYHDSNVHGGACYYVR